MLVNLKSEFDLKIYFYEALPLPQTALHLDQDVIILQEDLGHQLLQ